MEKESLYLDFRQAIGNVIDQATNRIETQSIEPLIKSIEVIMNHGFKTNKTLFQSGRNVWNFVETTLSSPDIITTVISLTENAADERLTVFLETALVQQSLGIHMTCFYSDDAILKDWYQDWAIMRDFDYRAAIIGLLQGLNRVELNVHVKDRSRLSRISSIAQLGTLLEKGDQAFKSSLQTTIQTMGRVQSQLIETAHNGVESFKTATDKDVRITKLEEENKLLVDQLREEKNHRMAVEVELISLKLQKDKDTKRLQLEISRLEQLLVGNKIEFVKNDL